MTSVDLNDVATLELVKSRIEVGRSWEAAMHGDFGLLIDRARAGKQLGKPELEFIAALLAGELPFAKVALNRKALPDREQENRELEIVNLVLEKIYSGASITDAVTHLEEELTLAGTPLSDRTIWTYMRKWAPGGDLWVQPDD